MSERDTREQVDQDYRYHTADELLDLVNQGEITPQEALIEFNKEFGETV